MHTKNLFVSEDGSTLRAEDPIHRCIGAAYGWDREFEYDANGKLANAPKPNDEAKANAKLWAAADELAKALRQCTEHMEWSTDQGKAAYEAANAALEKAGVK